MLTDYYYLISFDSFPLFLHVLTSLIKLALWLKFFRRQRTWEGKDCRILLHFNSSSLN